MKVISNNESLHKLINKLFLWLYNLIIAVECIYTVIFVLKCGKAQHRVSKIGIIKNIDGISLPWRHSRNSTISMHKIYAECQMWCLLSVLRYDKIDGVCARLCLRDMSKYNFSTMAFKFSDLELVNFSWPWLNFQGHTESLCFKSNFVYAIFPVVLCW